MRTLLIAPAAALLAVGLSAQPDHFTPSPSNGAAEGSTSVDLIGKEPLLRFQQADATNVGSKSNRNRWAFRRDGLLPDNAAYGARTIELEMTLGETNMATLSTNFDSNYISGTKAVAITRKQVAFPDWTFAPATAPQGSSEWAYLFFDNVVSYAGTAASGNDWLWEVQVYSNDKAGQPYPMDADPVLITAQPALVTSLGGFSGCVTAGQTSGMNMHFDMFNHGNKFSAVFDIGRAPANQPAAILLGAVGGPIVVPGFCKDLEVVPTASLLLGNTDATGFALLNVDPIPYNAGIIGADIYSQGIVLDPSQPGVQIGITNGRKVTVPSDPPSGSQCKHLWSLDPASSTATSGVVDGGILCQTNHT